MTTTPTTQSEHGQIVSSPDPGWMTPWRRRAYTTHRAFRTVLRPVRRGLVTVGGLAVDGFAAWSDAVASLAYVITALTIGIFLGVGISLPLVPTTWALRRTWDVRYSILTIWALAAVAVAAYRWVTDRRTPIVDEQGLDKPDDITDQMASLTATVADLADTLAQQLNDQHGGAA